MELKKWFRRSGWLSSKKELAERIERIEHIILNITKEWFQKSMDSLPKRWQKVIDLEGEMSDFLTPKYH